MATANINVDATLKAQAQQVFESIGLDMSTAKRISRRGVWKGKYTLPKDFDDPLDDFNEYMQ